MAGTGGKIAVTNRPRALAVLIAVFLVGCLAGASGSYYWLKKEVDVRNRHRDEGPPGPQGRQRWMQLLHSLQLTSEQDAQFKEIMTESRKQVDPLWKQQEPLLKQMDPLRKQLDVMRDAQFDKLDAIRAETNRKLLAILNPEQKKLFEAFLKESQEMRRRPPRGREFGPPPPPPDNPGGRN
jgi:Spy/CpxP family protein refolding chaperone